MRLRSEEANDKGWSDTDDSDCYQVAKLDSDSDDDHGDVKDCESSIGKQDTKEIPWNKWLLCPCPTSDTGLPMWILISPNSRTDSEGCWGAHVKDHSWLGPHIIVCKYYGKPRYGTQKFFKCKLGVAHSLLWHFCKPYKTKQSNTYNDLSSNGGQNDSRLNDSCRCRGMCMRCTCFLSLQQHAYHHVISSSIIIMHDINHWRMATANKEWRDSCKLQKILYTNALMLQQKHSQSQSRRSLWCGETREKFRRRMLSLPAIGSN